MSIYVYFIQRISSNLIVLSFQILSSKPLIYTLSKTLILYMRRCRHPLMFSIHSLLWTENRIPGKPVLKLFHPLH